MTRRGRYRRGSGYSYGRERARQHIQDARRLSAELGGMDQEVKAYFFALPASELERLLIEYGQRNGSPAEQYARETMQKWRSGSVQMSGTVAERLFNLLPPRMPVAAKHRLVEGLWHHVGPSSKKTLRIGLDADLEGIVSATRDHIEGVVVRYQIPEQLERRFQWLSAGDARIKQELLNYLRDLEKALVVNAARAQMPVMLEHLRADTARHTTRLAQILKVGKHELELLLDRETSGVRLEDTAPAWRTAGGGGGGLGGIWWVVIAIGAVILWMIFMRH